MATAVVAAFNFGYSVVVKVTVWYCGHCARTLRMRVRKVAALTRRDWMLCEQWLL